MSPTEKLLHRYTHKGAAVACVACKLVPELERTSDTDRRSHAPQGISSNPKARGLCAKNLHHSR